MHTPYTMMLMVDLQRSGPCFPSGQEEELDVDEVILLDENKEEECVKAIKQFYLNPHKAQLSSNVSCGMESR